MKKLAILFACTMTLCACSDSGSNNDDNNNNPRKTISLTTNEQDAVAAANELAYRTFRHLNDDTKNIAFSPLSSQMALSMTANGASGQTLDEMLELLSPDGTLSTLNSLYGKLYDELPSCDAKTKLTIANSFWLDKKLEPIADFRSVLNSDYGAKLNIYDKKNPKAAVSMVNEWMKDNTNGMITDLVTEDVISDAIIANAIAFKSEWREKFDKKNSKQEAFHKSNGDNCPAIYMNGCQKGIYGEIGTTEFATLHFGNGNFSITFVMPEYGKSPCEAIGEYLDFEEYPGAFSNIYDITLKIPRFEASAKHDLIPAYKALGIERAFYDTYAELNGICKQGATGEECSMYIKYVLQECRVSIDEDGAEAAASTSVSTEISTSVGTHGATFELTRPFAYIISESSTGAFLFMGTINGF